MMYALCKPDNPERPVFSPLVDIYENDRELVIVADLPGVGRETLEVSLERGVLRIHATVPNFLPGGCQFVRREFHGGDFFRAFIVGDEVEVEGIAAELDEGVLTIHLPKATPTKPRRIEVASRATPSAASKSDPAR